MSAEVVAGSDDTDSADEGSVGDDTILAGEAVLTVNEVEEVLRDAFAEADQLASITNAQGPIPVGEDLILDLPEPSLYCLDVRHHSVRRGTDTDKVRLKRYDLRGSCRRGTAFRRTGDQGNAYLYSKPPDLSNASRGVNALLSNRLRRSPRINLLIREKHKRSPYHLSCP